MSYDHWKCTDPRFEAPLCAHDRDLGNCTDCDAEAELADVHIPGWSIGWDCESQIAVAIKASTVVLGDFSPCSVDVHATPCGSIPGWDIGYDDTHEVWVATQGEVRVIGQIEDVTAWCASFKQMPEPVAAVERDYSPVDGPDYVPDWLL